MTILFLHGGPGLNASAERAWFGARIPVDWWDQPPVATLERPFRALCDMAVQRLEYWHVVNGAPVPVLAHSFGAVIAHELCLRRPELISQLVLLTPLFNPLSVLGPMDENTVGLSFSPHTADQILAALIHRGEIFDDWWSKESKEIRHRVLAHLPNGPHFDKDSFAAVTVDYLKYRDESPSPANVSTIVVLGTEDALRDINASEEALQLFPGAEIRWMPCAHQPLFELTDVPLPG